LEKVAIAQANAGHGLREGTAFMRKEPDKRTHVDPSNATERRPKMESGFVVILLALFTLLAFVVVAIIDKRKTERRMDDPSASKSTLAADKSSTGKPADV
jgi:hypothetical protein